MSSFSLEGEEGGTTPSAPPSIIIPGPELAHKINQFASKLSTFEKRKAEEMMAKTLASQKRNKFLYIEPSHIFYPYFLQKLTEYRQNPSLRVEKEEKKQGGSGGEGERGGGSSQQRPRSAADSTGHSTSEKGKESGSKDSSKITTTTTTTSGGRIQVQGGSTITDDPIREALLRKVEEEARKYEQDPHPPRYRLNLEDGTLEVPPLAMELISLSAQYVAKYGNAFLEALQAKQQRFNSVSFQFLDEKDPRHPLFSSLVATYRLILGATDDAQTEARLVDQLGDRGYVEHMISEKMKYVKATLARRQAALLTDEVLRQKLQWSYFEVVHTFTLSDLLLDGPTPPTARSLLQSQGVYDSRYYDHNGIAGAGSSSAGYSGVEEVDGEEVERGDLEMEEDEEEGERKREREVKRRRIENAREKTQETDPTAADPTPFTIPMTTNFLSSALVRPST